MRQVATSRCILALKLRLYVAFSSRWIETWLAICFGTINKAVVHDGRQDCNGETHTTRNNVFDRLRSAYGTSNVVVESSSTSSFNAAKPRASSPSPRQRRISLIYRRLDRASLHSAITDTVIALRQPAIVYVRIYDPDARPHGADLSVPR